MGAPEGAEEGDGDGACELDGVSDGVNVGSKLGAVDVEGDSLGACEKVGEWLIDGASDGISDGAELGAHVSIIPAIQGFASCSLLFGRKSW
jgi:hypothetical protein